eukprot:749175-Hanusia_phi.AAC.2
MEKPKLPHPPTRLEFRRIRNDPALLEGSALKVKFPSVCSFRTHDLGQSRICYECTSSIHMGNSDTSPPASRLPPLITSPVLT